MKSLLHSLADSDSVLLMYLFDELPAEDRADVESMLSTDHGLRTRLEELLATHEQTTQLLAHCDATSKNLAKSEQIAQRNAIKLMSQWTLRKSIDRPVPQAVSPLRKYVLYPAISMAAMMLLGLILWGMFGPPPQPMLPGDVAVVPSEEERIQLAELQRSLQPSETFDEPVVGRVDLVGEELLVRSLDSSEEVIREALQHPHINAAESQIALISRLTEDPGY